VSTEAVSESALARTWWLRAAAVLVAPRAVFASLRDDSPEAAAARQEPILLIAGLAGIAGVLGTHTFRRALNDGQVSMSLVAVLAFIAGALYALTFYWLGGGLLYRAARRLGSEGTWMRSRHVLGLAAVPLALSLLTLWPIRIAVYGTDLFRSGGNDYGRGDAVFGTIYYAFIAWSVWLLFVGVRSVHGWSWARATATILLAAVVPALIVLAATV
jgi:Yip1 domain